jgi:glycosyltransferase involved in cell wall biosynthesis
VSNPVVDPGNVLSPTPTSQPHRIIGLFPELLGVGGVQEAGRQTAAALDQIARCHGWRTAFLSLNDASGNHQLPSTSPPLSLRGFGRAKIQFLLAALGLAGGNTNMTIAGHPNLALPAAFMKIVSPGLKTIVISHGVEVWQPLSRIRRAALHRADLVLAPSRYTAQKLNELQGIPAEKIRQLPWPLSPDFLALATDPVSLPLPLEFPQGNVILTVGRWVASERYKGVDDLIRALAQLRNVIPRLHLVAVGEGDDLPRLQAQATKLDLHDAVHFFQGLSRKELAACYARSDVFALPSAGEGFGLVFLEAMAFAKPIVAARAGGATDVVENEVNGLLVPVHDPEQLAHALARLFLDDALRADLGRRGLEKVHSQYNFIVFASELEAILKDLVRCGLGH